MNIIPEPGSEPQSPINDIMEEPLQEADNNIDTDEILKDILVKSFLERQVFGSYLKRQTIEEKLVKFGA